jgi:3-hydroxyacyl-CoA dehydrogenase / enoyl-CoA hydratase / 3-hydroxybutyryl-CoA epimerase
MKTIQYELQNGIATLTFDEPDSQVNTMCQQWQADLTEATAQVVKDKDAITGIILASNKTTFFAGADLKGLMRNTATDVGAIFTEIERMKKNFRTLETLGKPVVSCLNGAALGGGWEVALVGHYRVAVDDKKIQFGMPEVSLGLIPGASGITKTTRLLGLMGAQPYLLEGKLFNPREGFELGLIHELVADAAALRPAALAWIAANPVSAQPWDNKDYKIPGGTPANPKIAMALTVAPAMMKKTSRGLYPAPEAALAAMVEGAQVDFDTALRIESRYLARLAVDPVAKNMINTFFFNMNAVKSRLRKLKEANPSSTPKLTAGISPEALSRIASVYQTEGVAMQKAGVPIAVINNASYQCGMTVALNLPEQTDLRESAWNITDVKDRLLYRQAVEAARCLHEGVLTTVHDANIGSIFGIGFPAYTGGAMQFIYGMGVAAFVKRAAELAAKFGEGFAVTDAVVQTIRKFQPVY